MKFFLQLEVRRFFCVYLIGIIVILFSVKDMQAERVSNAVVVFAGLDKITGRTIRFEVSIGQVYQYGALRVTPRVCYTSSEGESTRTNGFVEVDEITLNKETRRIFTGWMFADSPGLNAVEHPIYDIWLKDCKQSSDILSIQ
ncbi:DUF2155 domain-containing protein [Bartonella sp. WD12.1]|uniref:DUF2155 domain-containing protein n=1 Tax=Bartonella sp. WD12.1 TaxID=1933903 RepID=UPI00099B1339|nr:DUF2155 domain-containing protein [Bartonella sp. WD12.1]OPB29357.1 hypothetical protein BWD121_003700 [Bartonella sp. WD12.1]